MNKSLYIKSHIYNYKAENDYTALCQKIYCNQYVNRNTCYSYYTDVGLPCVPKIIFRVNGLECI